MSKKDEIKEILNTLRVSLSILVGIVVLIVGNLVSRYDQGNFDGVFFLGVLVSFMFLSIIVLIVKKISKKTKEIKDL